MNDLQCPKCERWHPENNVKTTGKTDYEGRAIFQFYCFYCLTFLTTAPVFPEDEEPKHPEK